MENILGNRLKKLREKNGLTQKTVASKFGLTNFQLSRYENGQTNPDPDLITKFAEYYGVSTDYLLGRTNNPSSVVKESEAKYDALSEIRKLTDKHGIDHLFFYDIEKWKAMGPEEIKQLDEFFDFLSKKAKEKNQKE